MFQLSKCHKFTGEHEGLPKKKKIKIYCLKDFKHTFHVKNMNCILKKIAKFILLRLNIKIMFMW